MSSNATELDRSASGGEVAPPAASDPHHSDPVAGPGEMRLVEEEILIEEISIDGMCGVY
jgi:mycofactocin precursor